MTQRAAKKPPKVSLAPANEAIRAEANRIGWPSRFATDLDHDERAIQTMLPHEPFSWCLRSDGTHVGRAVATDERARALKMSMVAEAFDARNCRFYVWDGRTLRPMHSADAADSALRELSGCRYVVGPVRRCSLVSHSVGTRRAADDLATEWTRKYGEEFAVTDSWETR